MDRTLAQESVDDIDELVPDAGDDEEFAKLHIPRALRRWIAVLGEHETFAIIDRERRHPPPVAPIAMARMTPAPVPPAPPANGAPPPRLVTPLPAPSRLAPLCWRFISCGKPAKAERLFDDGSWRPCCEAHLRDLTPIEERTNLRSLGHVR